MRECPELKESSKFEYFGLHCALTKIFSSNRHWGKVLPRALPLRQHLKDRDISPNILNTLLSSHMSNNKLQTC